jgi:hypothetical protein
MASVGFSSERALAALQTSGFYSEDDPGVGERALKPFEDIDTKPGLEFYEHNFLDNTVGAVWMYLQALANTSSGYQMFSIPHSNGAASRVIGHSRLNPKKYISLDEAVRRQALF